MSDDRKDLPPVSAPNFNEKLRETISTYLGHRGNKLDRGVTLRDLSEANIIALSKGFLASGNGSGVRPIAGLGTAAAAYEADLTPPPPPDNLSATTSGASIQVTIAAQKYRQGHGPAKVVVFGAKYLEGGALPTYADAAVLDEFYGDVHAFPVDTASLYRIWAKSVSVDGVESAVAGGINGVAPVPGLLDDVSIASLTASKIRSGSVTVGQFIQAANYVPGLAGWRINGDGTAEFANALVRGGVYASYGQIGGNTIDATGVQSPGYVPGAVGWRLSSSGALNARTGNFSGSLNGASITGTTGTFSGSLSGADITGTTGTFSGKLAAGTVDFASSVGSTINRDVGTHLITVPDAMTSMRVLLIGAGGGGAGGGKNDSGFAGGGGGAGGRTSFSLTVSPGQQFTIVCGVGGAGGGGGAGIGGNWGSYTPGNTGGTGEQTYLAGYIAANGGAGGDGYGNGGAGGTATNGVTGLNGEFAEAGGAGGTGGAVPSYGTGGTSWHGGASAGTRGGGGGGGHAHLKNYDYNSPGGAGGNGYAVIEFFNERGVVLRGEMDKLKVDLTNYGITLTQ